MELTVSPFKKNYTGPGGERAFELNIPEIRMGLPTVLFLMGHNGSGKSVFLRIIGGEELPSGPPVRLSNGSVHWIANKRPCPIVRQNVEQSLALDLTVEQNLLLRLAGNSFAQKLMGARSRRAAIENVLVPQPILLGKLQQPCRLLSGGQKQTLAFIAITCNRSPILLLDEFLAAADLSTSQWLISSALSYANSVPACVIIATHDVELALSKGTRIIILRDGAVVEDIHRDDGNWNLSFVRSAISCPLTQASAASGNF